MIWLIAKREFRTRAMSKASIISTAVMVVLIVAAALIARPFLVDDGEIDPTLVQIDPATEALAPYVEAAAATQELVIEFRHEPVAPEPTLVDGVEAALAGLPSQPELFMEDGNDALAAAVHAAVQQATLDSQVERLGGDPAAFSQAMAEAAVTVTMLGDQDEFDAGAMIAGFIVVLVLFFVLIQSASVIMMGVVEEKSSRVVEILLATVRPSTLLGGKILGVGLYALLQAAAMLLPAVFALIYLELPSEFGIDVGALVMNFSVWFVLGFAIFAVLFGGLAALVSRQEDLGAVTTPMMLLMLAPLYLAIYMVPSSPDGPVTMFLTQVPFFSPFLVPMRAAFGAIAVWEVALALAIALASIPVLVWVAGRVYAGAVLSTGGRMKLKEAFRRG